MYKNSEFLNWIKSKHANILVIFAHGNCTSKLHSAYVILQRSIKHAFRLEFHNWTATEVKLHIEANGELEVDLSMNNLKSRIHAWLLLVWTQVKKMEAMIQKGWQKYGIERVFLPTFQLKAMEANVESPLFTMNHDLERRMLKNNMFLIEPYYS